MPLKNDHLEDFVTHQRAWISALTSMAQEEGPLQEYWNGVAIELQSAGHIAKTQDLITGAQEARSIFPQIKTALSIMEATAGTPDVDQDDASYWRHEMDAFHRFEASLDEMLGTKVTLQDWREEADAQEDDLAEPTSLTIKASATRIDVEVEDGRSLWLELQGQDFRVMAYNSYRDEPAILKVPAAGEIASDMRDYRAGPALDADEDDSPSP